MDGPRLDVVIVSYRRADRLRDCLRSLAPVQEAGTATLTVVDNASGDGTIDLVAREFPAVRAIPSRESRTLAAARNVGIRGRSAPYVLVLDPDTVVPAGALDALLTLLDARPEIGCCGCRLTSERGGSREAGPVETVPGSFMLLRRRAVAQVKLFDESFTLGVEDRELCHRLRQAGWVVWREPGVVVEHTGPGRPDARRLAQHHLGLARFHRKHVGPMHAPWFNVCVYAALAARLAAAVATAALGRLSGRPS